MWLTRSISQSASGRSKSRGTPRSTWRRMEELEDRTLLATFTVNSTGDASDVNKSDSKCDTGKMIDSMAECTLRAAIEQANANGNPTEQDTVVFALPSVGPHIISPKEKPFDSIAQRIFIDGYSQAGAVPNTLSEGSNAKLAIVLNGLQAGPDANGLHLTGGFSVITGLVIGGFTSDGIRIEGGGNNLIIGNFIGTNTQGDVVASNGRDGVAIVNSPSNQIGGILPANLNVISGNQISGVRIHGLPSTTNNVLGNLIGTDASGSKSLGNARVGDARPGCTAGLEIQDAPLNFIGGALPGEHNVISGNDGCGIMILGIEAKANVVFGNFIGTDRLGQHAVPNKKNGILITAPVGSNSVASGNEIGGVQTGWRNVISGNGGNGVEISSGSSGNKVRGNYIGVTAASTTDLIGDPLGNGVDGVAIFDSPNNTIGGGDADDGSTDGNVQARNIISANVNRGVFIALGGTGGGGANGNRILGNFIGTDISGSIGGALENDSFGNGTEGVFIRDVANSVVGGAGAGEGNLISGNGNAGVLIMGKSASGNRVLGNFIGTDALGKFRVPNPVGVQIADAPGNFIGDPAAGVAGAPRERLGDAGIGGRNVISGNRLHGVQILDSVLPSTATANRVQNNFIGTTSDGSAELGNDGHGIHILGPSGNMIGGTNVNESNSIAFNGRKLLLNANRGNGITLEGGKGNVISQNRIFENYGLGIDLVDFTGTSFTPNDADDADTGSNNLQNFPVFTAEVSGGLTTIRGFVTGPPLITPIRIEFFANSKSNATQIGQGEKYLGFEIVTSDENGEGEFFKVFTGAERNITATATNLLTMDTSEFSKFSVIQSVEFTQAIQILQPLAALKKDLKDDGAPPIPLVAKKPAVLRVYPSQVSQATSLEFDFEAPTVNGTIVGVKEPLILGSACTPDDRRRANAGCFSADFYFTPPVGEWTATLKVRDSSGNELETHEFTLESKESDALVLNAVSVCDIFSPNFGWGCQNAGTLAGLLPFLRAIAPTDDVRVVSTGHQTKLHQFPGDMNGNGSVNDCVIDFQSALYGCEPSRWWVETVKEIDRLFTVFEPAGGTIGDEERYYWGVIAPAVLGGLAGYSSSIPGRSGAGLASVMRFGVQAADTTVAHEIGHLMGRRHTNTVVPGNLGSLGCWNTAIDGKTDWPYLDNYIQSGPFTLPVPEVGFDMRNKTVVAPGNVFELMSYCSPRWISPHTYLGMLSVLGPKPTNPSGNPEAGQMGGDLGNFWLVSGSVEEGGNVSLGSLFAFETIGPMDARNGTHRMEVRGTDGTVLFTRFFTPAASSADTEPDGEDVEGKPFFSELVPVQPSAARIVVLDPQGVEMGGVALAGESPVVAIDFPTRGETIDGIQEIRWSVNDPDSSSHTYWAQYSADNGATWQSLGSSLFQTTLVQDFGNLPGSQGSSLVRVFASDGTNSGMAISAPFSVSKNLPQAEISTPEHGAEFRLHNMVWLQAAGFDIDDRSLDDSAYHWESSLDGFLGHGDDLPLTTLSVGTHAITLTITDSDGNQASDMISITVADTPLIEEDAVPAVVEFAASSIVVDESAGVATITVIRMGDAAGRITVDFATEDVSARAGRDYQPVSGTLRFEDGQTNVTFDIPLLDDGRAEPPEIVHLILSDIKGAAGPGASTRIELRIIDDEAAGAATFVVTNANDTGLGSLRQAILDANAKVGADFIHFNIPGDSIHTITQVLPLPKITDPVSIDGYSQPGSRPNALSQGNDATLRIELDGTQAMGNGLEITGGNSMISGLVINRFVGFGIALIGQGDNEIEGNFIGTDVTGTIGLGNGPNGGGLGGGVRILDSTDNRIGGSIPELRNVISANRGAGVQIEISDIELALSGCGVTALPLITCNQVQGNYIGTAGDGVGPLGNRTGVSVVGASDNLIGGTDLGEGNIIAFSLESGVEVREQSKFFPGSLFLDQTLFLGGTRNAIRGNAIFANSRFYASVSPVQFRKNGAAIDLADRDDLNRPSRPIAVNDPGDRDGGPNNLQNYPVLESAIGVPGSITIRGHLDGLVRHEFNIDVFANRRIDPSGFGEGERYLGSTVVRTDGTGHAEFTATFMADVLDGWFITATATDQENNTSEFSARIEVGDILNSDTFTVNSTNDVDDGVCNAAHCSLREALHSSNNHPGLDTIRFSLPGGGVRTISPLLDLPPSFDPVIIDGYSQPGSRPNSLVVGNDANLLVQVGGFNAGQGSLVLATGLNIAGGNSTVRGLVLNRLADGPLVGTTGIGLFVQRRGGNRIEGNFIGTDAFGNTVPPDPSGSSVPTLLTIASSDNTIGGTTPAARNVLRGVELMSLNRTPADPTMFLTTADRNVVQGNYIGTRADGVGIPTGFSNGHTGVAIAGSENVIGGIRPEARNVIAGNTTGVTITGRENQILGNLIGVAVDGVSFGNQLNGVVLQPGAINNVIGGIASGEGNMIRGHRRSGVLVQNDPAGTPIHPRGNAIRGNAILNNGLGQEIAETGLGIDLGASDWLADELVTINDNADRDGGPNGLQNFPVLHSAIVADGAITITGRLESQPQDTFQLDFYSNATMHTSGHGEGALYIGSTSVVTDSVGHASFSVDFRVAIPNGQTITATATNSANGTSEFSTRIVVGNILTDQFTVNTTSLFDDGICDASHCSLTEAIHGSNNHPGHDLITFNIPGDGVQFIEPVAVTLPPITDPVTIDGYSQPGARANMLADGNDAVPLIELSGVSLSTFGTPSLQIGLNIRAGETIVRGLIMNRFQAGAILMQENGGNRIEGNFVGVSESSEFLLGQGMVWVHGSSNNRIGGITPDTRNLISATQSGVLIEGECGPPDDEIVMLYHTAGNQVIGNYIGTDRHGTARRGGQGVRVICAVNNTIGGAAPEERNVISGNDRSGVLLGGNHGVPANNRLLGNYVGTDRTGLAALGNQGVGVEVTFSGNIVGGSVPGAGNVIAANRDHGIVIGANGLSAEDLGLGDHVVQGNLIGVNRDGVLGLGNGGSGMIILSSCNLIGGSSPGSGNVISANGEHGIVIASPGFSELSGDIPTQDNVVQGNHLGIGLDGDTPFGNAFDGVAFQGRTVNNLIGGTESGQGNVIAYNGRVGISASLTRPNEPVPPGRVNRGNSFLANSIFSNLDLGIDLNADGVTLNDLGDGDSGANDLQNAPVITAFASSGAGTAITGSLNSRPNDAYRLEFFANTSADNSKFGEGERFIGTITVTTDASGNASFAVTFPVSVPSDQVLSATATDSDGNTSEFSERRLEVNADVSADLGVAMIGAPDPVFAGQLLTYTIEVSNGGPNVATGVTLIDTLSEDVAFVSAVTAQGACSGAGSGVICNFGTIAAEASVIVEIQAVPTRAALIGNQVSVSSNQTDADTLNNATRVETIALPAADLEVAVSGFPSAPLVGNVLTYTVTVRNHGPSPADSVVLRDTLPAEVVFSSAVTSQGTCSDVAGIITCDLNELASGAEATLMIEVLTNTVSTIINQVDVVGGTADPSTANNRTNLITTVRPWSDLALDQFANPNPSNAGGMLTYTLNVTNNGPSDSENVVINDTLPPDVDFLSASASQGTCLVVGGDVTCELGSLANGNSAAIEIVVTPTKAGIFLFHQAEVTAATEDVFVDNNTSLLTTIVSAACPAVLYGAAANDDGMSILYAIDPVTGATAPVGPIGFLNVSGMDFHPSTQALYATAERVDGDGLHHVLIQIDPCTGAGTEVGPTNIQNINFNSSSPDISFRNSDGKLFAYLMLERELATIDIATGRASAVGATSAGGRHGNGIAFATDGALYHADGVNLNILNTTSGLATRQVALGFSHPADHASELNALEFDPASGVLFGSLNAGFDDAPESYLATVNIVTGAVTIIGPTVNGLDALAFTDALINHAPTITSDGGGDMVILSAQENSIAVTQVAAEDPDTGAGLMFSIVGGADMQRFAIDALTGVLTFVDVPNFEEAADFDGDNNYDVTVQVSDGRLIDRQAIMVELQNVLELQSFLVQRGAAQRSFVRYIDLVFDDADELQRVLADGRVQLTRFDLNGISGESTGLAGRMTRNGAALAVDFGVQGIGGNRNTNTGDGYYHFGIDSDGDGTFELTRSFYRLFGDVTGDRMVSDADVSAIGLALGRTGAGLAEDANGDDVVNALDRLYASRAIGRRLASGLNLDGRIGNRAALRQDMAHFRTTQAIFADDQSFVVNSK